MSKYKEIETAFTNLESLKKALEDIGFKPEVLEVAGNGRENSLPMYGYRDDLRPEKCAIRIPRKHVSSAANDVGWAWDAKSGKYTAVISEYDSGNRFSQATQNLLAQRYAYHEVSRKARMMGYRVQEKQEAGKIRLTLVKS